MPTPDTRESDRPSEPPTQPVPAAPAPDAACVEIAGRTYATTTGLAHLLGVTPRTLSRWDERRIGPSKIKIGKMVLFEIGKIPAWLETHERKAVNQRSSPDRRSAK